MKNTFLNSILAALLVLSSAAFNVANANEDIQAKPKIKAIAVTKSLRTLQLIDANNQVYKTYNVSLGTNPIGPKQKSGDGKTPEGRYIVSYKNPQSKFHLSLNVSYPNAQDRKNAKELGVNPGGDIMIHGIGEYGWVGGAHTLLDWTQGCIAVTNEEIEEIYSVVKEGTVIYIWP